MPEIRTHDDLSRLLRAADPAAGDPGLDRPERARMRQRILDEARRRQRHSTAWMLPAATAMALLLLALGLALRQPTIPGRTRTAGPVAEPPRVAADDVSTSRQIQFTTDSGTLVIWVLQPRAAG